METQNLIQRLKQCEDMPLFRKVLLNQTSFEDEIENFYGYERWISHRRFGPYTYYQFNKKENKENYDKYPKDLVDILNRVANKPFDIEKLKYNKVREDFKAISNNNFNSELFLVGTSVSLTSIPATYAENYLLSLSSIILGGIVYTYSMRKKSIENGAYQELKRLSTLAQTLDEHMEQYKLNVIKEKFG